MLVAEVIVNVNTSRGEYSAEVLVEADAGILRDAGGVGIEGLEKIPDLLPNLLL
jgi:hypothetical protein